VPRMLPIAVCVLSAGATFGCSTSSGHREGDAPPLRPPAVTRAAFGTLPEGDPVEAFTLTTAHGVTLQAITYGGIITSLRTPDREGRVAEIVLGYETLDGYLQRSPYFGAIVGRYANRIANGHFTIDGTTYQLPTNNGPNHLHGGRRGFDKVNWAAEPFERADAVGVVFTHVSPDGDQGYPGQLTVSATYTLDNDGTLTVTYEATTDKPTHVNLSQHSYFNLLGDAGGDVLEHELTIHADRYTPVDATLIPTGELAPVEGTPFDFRRPTPIGARIDADHPQIRNGLGYDHNFVLNREGDGLVDVVRVVSPTSGRTLDVATTEPGLQFYTGNFLDGSITGRNGVVYQRRQGFCLETQHFPDSPNKPQFPSTLLRPGETYRSTTAYHFGVTPHR
jgi:aldose 1-epimerase